MKIYDLRLKVFLLKDIHYYELQESICSFIDESFNVSDDLIEFHKKRGMKGYCFNLLYPIEKDGNYKKHQIYSIIIRTVFVNLAKHFSQELPKQSNNDMKGLTCDIKVIPQKHIDKIYNITPSLIKGKNGYWRDEMSFQEFENRLFINMIKKYNDFTGKKLDEDFIWYNAIEFINKKPIAIPYKGKVLLGDKISMQIADNERAQTLAKFSLGVGTLENCSRGAGFLGFRWV